MKDLTRFAEAVGVMVDDVKTDVRGVDWEVVFYLLSIIVLVIVMSLL